MSMLSKDSQNETSDHALRSATRWIIAIGLVTFALSALLYVFYYIWFAIELGQPLSQSASDWGTFGDFIGGLANPMVGLATLVIVALAYLAQRRELEKTISALTHSASEQARMAKLAVIQGHIQVKTALLNTKVETLAGLHNEVRRLAAVDQISGQLGSVLSFRGKPLTSEHDRIQEIKAFLPTIDTVSKEIEDLKVELVALADELSSVARS